MKIIIKTDEDIRLIKEAVKIWKKTRNVLIEKCDVGVRLLELDEIANQTIESLGGKSTFLNMYGFPKHLCISVNDCVIHGIPNDYCLKDGDLVKFDLGVTYENHICDAAFNVVIGNNNKAAIKIKDICDSSLVEVTKIIKPGITNIEIAKFLQNYIESNGYEVLRDFTGHGCGNQLHEDPAFPNYYDSHFPVVKLKENMVFCLEPMILTDSKEYYIDDNHWNVYSANGLLTCHTEHMFVVTKDGCINLILSDD